MKQENHQQQEQEVISEELIRKFDGDQELIEKFMKHGYTTQQLEQSDVVHVTETDPAVVLNGKTIGFWLP